MSDDRLNTPKTHPTADASARLDASDREAKLIRIYWTMRLGIGFIWIWTAFVSWYIYPHGESIAWLRMTGLTNHTETVLAAACVVDLLFGVISCLHPARRIWQIQFIVVASYSIVIGIFLPEFLMHPFGPITKNVAVLACLAYLAVMERY